MGYRLGDKEIKMSGKRVSKISSDSTGDVYKYRNTALKVFKKDKTPPMDVETAKHLSSISTHRVLLPKNLLFYNNSFRGYSYKLVSKKGTGKRLIMLPKDELTENISIIEDDIKQLSNRQVLLSGVDPANTLFNGRLYLTDPTGYSVLDVSSTEHLEVLNKYQLHLLITALITSEVRRTNFNSRQEKQVKELLELKDDTYDTSEFLDEVIGTNDSMYQLVKKMR